MVARLKAPKNDRADLERSTRSLVLPPLGSHMRLVLDADLVDGAHLPSPGQKLGDLLADLSHPSGDRGFIAAFVEGVGKLEAHTEEAHEQLVGGVGGVLHTEF